MRVKIEEFGPRFGVASLVTSFGGHRVRFEAENGSGAGASGRQGAGGGEGNGGGAGGGTGNTPGGEGGSGAGEGNNAGGNRTPTDEEARLLKEVMEKKTKLGEVQKALETANNRLKEFEGIDPAEVRKLLEERANAEKTALEKKGEYERLKEMMVDEHKKQLGTYDKRVKELETQLEESARLVNELTVGSAFNGSKFIADELILTPAKARVIFGGHFAVEDGMVVGYDKPAGAAERTKLVGADGNPLPFEEAIKKLVEADPDRDRLMKSKLAPGAGSNTTGNKPPPRKPDVHGLQRIELALENKLKGKK